MAKRCVWEEIVGQDRAVALLKKAAREGAPSHAYLFAGPPGVGKKTAARAFACALICGDEGCGGCRACARIRRDAHPDVHVIAPEGAATYLVEQVRDLIHDLQLRPVEASRSVYLLDHTEAFNAESANALLKSLEEPPPDVTLVLLAGARDDVLPTIASRCQTVPFARIPTPLAVGLVAERAGVDETRANAALAASGGVVPRAIEVARSRERGEVRDRTLALLKDLAVMDGADLLVAAKELMVAAKAPLDELRASHDEELAARRELMGGTGSTKSLEERQKREMTAREREGVLEVLAVSESWLRDCLAIGQGAPEVVFNTDRVDSMEEVAAVLSADAALRGLHAVHYARRRISYNVSPQLAIEAMLMDIREVLRCPR